MTSVKDAVSKSNLPDKYIERSHYMPDTVLRATCKGQWGHPALPPQQALCVCEEMAWANESNVRSY